MSLYERARPSPEGHRDVVPAQLEPRPDGVRLVDVREAHELVGELGHIEGVEHVPLAQVVEAARAWSKDAELVCICRGGARSAKAASALVQLGFTKVMNLVGGMQAWNAEGRNVKR